MKSEQNNRKMKTVLISISVIMIITSAFIIGPYLFPKVIEQTNNQVQEKEVKEDIISYELKKSISKLSPILNVTVLDKDGNLKAQQIKEDDLVLENFLKFFVGLLYDPNSNDRHVSLYDTGGTLRTFAIYDTAWTAGTYPFNKVAAGAGGHIGIGNGTTSPTRQDYNLESQQESYVAISTPGYLLGLIAMGASWSVTSNYSVSEVVFINNWGDTGASRYDVALFRDTFTPISVLNGDQIFVTYSIWLNNTGFTNNFGEFLRALFEDGGVARTFAMSDITGTPRNFYSYYPYVFGGGTTNHWNYNNARIYIAVGENQTISRSNIKLSSMIGSYVGGSQPTQNTSAVLLSAAQTMAVSANVSVAGLFVYWRDTSGGSGIERTVMFWHLNFSNVLVYSGYTLNVAFKLIT